jgi:type I restriction enzyme M protein
VGWRQARGRVETDVAWRVTAGEVKTGGYDLDIKNPHVVADDHGDPEQLLKALDDAELETAR